MRPRVVLWFAVLALLKASVTHAMWKLTCVDGSTEAYLKVPGQPSQPVSWATCDAAGDGVCDFTVERSGCACPGTGCCGFDEFSVPVHRQLLVQSSFGRPKLRLRCRAPSPCEIAHQCRSVSLTCHDGVLGPMQEGQCDLDELEDGTCAFGFYCMEVCGPLVDSVKVPVGQSRVVQRPNLPRITFTQYTLRCQP